VSLRRPPLLSRLLLAVFLRGLEREVITGDLEEEFQHLAERVSGVDHARRWYRRQAWRAVGGRLLARGRRLVRIPAEKTMSGRSGRAGARLGGRVRGGWVIMGELFRDVRFGLRALMRQPGFTGAAVLVIALGVGANTAVFSILDGVLLRSLAYPDAERVVRVWGGRALSKSTLAEMRENVTAFEAVSGFSSGRYALTGEGQASEMSGAEVAPSYFDVIGVRPALGRAFLPEESEPGRDGVVILAYDLWRGPFAGAPDIVGRTIRLDGVPRTVVGVMPEGYRPVRRSWTVWVPQTADPTDFGDWEGTAGTVVVARLAPGATPERADAQLAPIAQAIRDENPDVYGDEFVAAATVTSLQRATVGSFRTTLWVLAGAVTLVLLIACANVANLLLAKGESRGHELAVRRSLGASGRRLVRQLMTESALLGLLGGGLGCGLAWLTLWTFREHVATALPLGDRVGLNGTVLGFALAVSLVTAILFGLWPALRALRPDLRASLRGEARSPGRAGVGRPGMSRTLVAFEVAISLVLLTGAGLLIKSTWVLQRVDPGFRSEDLLTLHVNLPSGRYEEEGARVEYFRRIDERLSAIPGVVASGSISFLPMTSQHMSTLFTVKDRPKREGSPREYAMVQVTTPGVARALGMDLLGGRWIEPSDGKDAPRVCVINQAMSKAAFGDDDPLGEEIQLFGWFNATVVGVVSDMREIGLARPPGPGAFLAYAQLPGVGAMYVTVRTAGAPRELIPSVVEAVAALDGDVPVSQVASMDDVLRLSIADSRLSTAVLSIFALLALLLSVVGVYGVISFTVSARTYEIGVRAALGAPRGTVVREVLSGIAVPVALGMLAGIGGALGLARMVESLLYEVHPRDPAVLAVAAVALLLAAVAASVAPARRAASVDPVRCLKV